MYKRQVRWFQTLRNTEYARRCVRHSLGRGEAPIASHLLYTQPGILDDNIPEERQWGIDAGLAWRVKVDASIVYTDHGITKGMSYRIKAAEDAGIPVEYRMIDSASASGTGWVRVGYLARRIWNMWRAA